MIKFDVICEVKDYGQDVVGIRLHLDNKVDKVVNDFEVSCKTIEESGNIHYEGKRVITNVTLEDENTIYVELESKFGDKASDAIYYDMVLEDGIFDFFHSFNKYLTLNYEVKTALGECVQDKVVQLLVDDFKVEKTAKGLPYRLFVPTIQNEKHPLIVWIHGSGEGGINNAAPIIANKGGVGFATKEAQEIFGGAYIAAPQADYNWSVDANHVAGINIPLPKTIESSRDYTPEVYGMIDEILAQYPDCDKNRVYIAGCSAGGAMTWKTFLKKPEIFACAVPICANDHTKEQLETVKDKAIWMVHSKDDTTVPVEHSITNYEILTALKASNAHITLYETVTKDGNNYPGHWSWIYACNNEPTLEDGTTLFEWMAKQSL